MPHQVMVSYPKYICWRKYTKLRIAEIWMTNALMCVSLKIPWELFKLHGQGIFMWKEVILINLGMKFCSYPSCCHRWYRLGKILKVLYYWVNSPPNNNKGEPHFSEVDNHDRWSSFQFLLPFGSGRHKGNYLLTGCVPVPNNDSGEHVVGGWWFNYDWRRR